MNPFRNSNPFANNSNNYSSNNSNNINNSNNNENTSNYLDNLTNDWKVLLHITLKTNRPSILEKGLKIGHEPFLNADYGISDELYFINYTRILETNNADYLQTIYCEYIDNHKYGIKKPDDIDIWCLLLPKCDSTDIKTRKTGVDTEETINCNITPDMMVLVHKEDWPKYLKDDKIINANHTICKDRIRIMGKKKVSPTKLSKFYKTFLVKIPKTTRAGKKVLKRKKSVIKVNRGRIKTIFKKLKRPRTRKCPKKVCPIKLR